MIDKIYLELAKHLDNMPAGFPKTRSGAELKLLQKFYTPEQARIAIHISPQPEPAATIAERLGMDPEEAAEKIEQMAREGSVFRYRSKKGPLYSQANFLMGIYEWHVHAVDKEMAEYADDYYEAMFEHHWKGRETKQLRVVPVDQSIEGKDAVQSYDVLRELVKRDGKGPYVVAPCICRVEKLEMGEENSLPMDTCLTFGAMAKYYIENGIGKELTEAELMDKLKECEEAALVPFATNSQDIANMCMCDGSCQLLKNLGKFPKPAEEIHSPYFAVIDADLCSACEECMDRCQLDAISETDDALMMVNRDRCIGCGLCVTTCPTEAINMQLKAVLPDTPKTGMDMHMRLMLERGLL
jgi:H+/Na+-translocating ferredoxin:NAD+ oxidoreductase subunit B